MPKKKVHEILKQVDALNQINAIEQETNAVEQTALNKAHDTEFSPYSDVNGQNTTMSNLNVIGEEEVKKAHEIFMRYRETKTELEQRLIDNEKFWKMQHWDVLKSQGQELEDERIKPKSAWLVNTILNKHADAMDNYPSANILARSRDDEEAAKILSDIIPVILEQNDYEETYSDAQWYKIKNGTSVQGVFWNNDKNEGLGDIDVKKIDLMHLYWKSGIEDIQDSPNVFYVNMVENDEIKAKYPDIKAPEQGLPDMGVDLYYGQNVDSNNMTAVFDWYYKKRSRTVDEKGIPKMKTTVHYCKFCNGQVIYASENDPNYAERGWYDHGQYPFVFDTLFPVEANVCGMGYVDIIADDQLMLDKMQQAFLENTIAGARPRYAVRDDGSLNEEEFLDVSNPLIHFSGNLGEDAFRQIVVQPLSNIYETVYLQKVQEMKDTSGNTATSQGQVSSVTTASGIATLTENAGKLSRDASSTSYRAYKRIIYQIIELIRQFYTEPRCFRIVGEMGDISYESFDNSMLLPQDQGSVPLMNGQRLDLGSRVPIMDIEVRTQKKSAYSKETQNQTALNLYNMGFFAPNNADASLACLKMMDFDGVEKIREEVSKNAMLYNQLMQATMLLEASGVLNQENVQQPSQPSQPSQSGGQIQNSKGSLTTQAAAAARGSTEPRG